VSDHEEHDEYAGDATLVHGDAETPVRVTLRGGFQPIDGRFHWYGRLTADAALAGVRPGGEVRLRTAHGEAAGRLSDVDPWGRLRITGTGRPPF
jgi:hypothetical protein